jgi:hypothetical protein
MTALQTLEDVPLFPELFRMPGAIERARAPSAHRAARITPKTAADHFRTPPWATRVLCEILRHLIQIDLSELTVEERACGRGDMARVLEEYFGAVLASDIEDYGFGEIADYLTAECPSVDLSITNPPFQSAIAFVRKALANARIGVAMFLPTRWQEGIGRYQTLFAETPPTLVAQFSERVPIHMDTLLRRNKTQTAYTWFIWLKSVPPTSGARLVWIPPCRVWLERWGDYDDDVGPEAIALPARRPAKPDFAALATPLLPSRRTPSVRLAKAGGSP